MAIYRGPEVKVSGLRGQNPAYRPSGTFIEGTENMEPFQSPEVEAVFAAYPEDVRRKLLALRQLIFDTAAGIKEAGLIEETLKWGQPSYLTSQSKSGTTLRIDQIKSAPGYYGLFVHCQTSLLETFRALYPDALAYDGKRCIRFAVDEEPPRKVLTDCIARALTYHLSKRKDGLPF